MSTHSASEFAAQLPSGGVLAGLDLGTKTIGVAFCDAEWRFATAAETIVRRKQTQDFAELRRLIGSRALAGFVLGYPVNMDGTDGPRAQATRAFARSLETEFTLPVLLWDERLSTVAVTREMIAADMSRAKRAERVDALAAAHILQAAIDALALAA
ncbi:Holliday junction resolvase RuvX [Sphingosinicella microcystinivorans]|uniref:Putative pre-16S rRNA nuclease n=1 Tax=Sphingosinicella microcystinivorans TaxID=335406 RepID=A0AAD1G1D1_SPHMI|nr:Holliday junction resolvase RuvX [Sphingosinicella microcystinivorans]RKS91653.1 putative Holliday junction resolvase [Sphingosinicella microcystinivorans]BBE34633.1 putative pre-16S rRNA nuclease [Sphingosinicella microcystinivorans]